ncbi:hypothetical protein [Sphingobium sp. MK2]|uniref:hypothetical protein n=1 Tax=Sphingobium sp. MK2 TaxID=3116540 RepID=UPI0032E35A16
MTQRPHLISHLVGGVKEAFSLGSVDIFSATSLVIGLPIADLHMRHEPSSPTRNKIGNRVAKIFSLTLAVGNFSQRLQQSKGNFMASGWCGPSLRSGYERTSTEWGHSWFTSFPALFALYHSFIRVAQMPK